MSKDLTKLKWKRWGNWMGKQLKVWKKEKARKIINFFPRFCYVWLFRIVFGDFLAQLWNNASERLKMYLFAWYCLNSTWHPWPITCCLICCNRFGWNIYSAIVGIVKGTTVQCRRSSSKASYACKACTFVKRFHTNVCHTAWNRDFCERWTIA